MAIARNILLCTVLLLIGGNLQSVLGQDCATDLQAMKPVIYIVENTLAGSILANITTHDEIMYDNSSGISQFIKFENSTIVASMDIFLDGPNNTEICQKTRESQPSVKIWCKQQPTFKVDLYFLLTYTDDYPPKFTSSVTAIKENAQVGATVVQLDAITTDEDCTNAFTFSIDEVSRDVFDVDNSKLRLVLKHDLDFEQRDLYIINLQVTSSVSNGPDSKSNNTNFTVEVEDVDDMSPVFDNSQFVLHVLEAQDVSSVWYNSTPPVLARDGDVGINTTLVYSWLSVTPNLKLDIQNETGEVNVLDILDREIISTYTVVVKAAQVDVWYRSATATLSIVVDDVNDNRPVYTSQNDVTIMEDAPNGSYLIELTGEDSDEDLNSQFDFSMGRDDIRAFDVFKDSRTNQTYLIVRNSTALRGLSQTYVQVNLAEREPPFPGSRSCDYINNCVGNVTVYITDANINTPVFQAHIYTFTIFSNHTGHINVGQVNATDADKGVNAKIVYSLSPISTSPVECNNLKMDPTTGALTTDIPLTGGVVCSWIVTACDSPADSTLRRCSSVYMSVTVILSGSVVEQTVHVPENVPIGTMVTTIPIKGLQTTDTDFEIKNDVLYTRVKLDREFKDRYQVDIHSGNASSTVVTIHVLVDDVNDNAPVFGHPDYVINIPDDTLTLNQTVLQVNASDADTGNNSRLAFSLVSGEEYLQIDSETGEIRITNIPTADMVFQLLVTDFGHPQLIGLARLSVFTFKHNLTASAILPVEKKELTADTDDVAAKLSSILGVIVKVLLIESLDPVDGIGPRSRVYIEATDVTGQPVSPKLLNQLVEMHALAITETFWNYKSARNGSRPREEDGLSILEIVLICVAGVLLLAVILLVTLWCRSQNKYKRSKRLFDSLNRNTIMYDNPIKSSSTSAAITTNSESNNAQRMLARLSNGSIGDNSVTNLLPKQRSGSNSGNTTPPTGVVPEREGDHGYVNVAHIDEIIALSQADNHNDNVGLMSSDQTHSVHVTTIDVQYNQHGSNLLETGTSPQIGDSTNSSAGQNSSSSNDEDSGMASDKGKPFEDVDENDEEVAHILSDSIPTDIILPPTDDIDSRSKLDLMTSFTQHVPPETFVNDGYGSIPGTSNQESLDINTLPEPEPDYAKKVRFSETTAAVGAKETLDSPNERNTSLGQFLTQHGGVTNSEDETANRSPIDDTIEELTAL